jgi:hypothetical protein
MEQTRPYHRPDEAMSEDWRVEHYRSLMERHLAESLRYQAYLYHAWATIRSQQKGLKRQAMKIRRLQAKCAAVQNINAR